MKNNINKKSKKIDIKNFFYNIIEHTVPSRGFPIQPIIPKTNTTLENSNAEKINLKITKS